MLKILIIASLASFGLAYPSFQDEIPNGKNVPNPCNGGNGTTWVGVGHHIESGGGTRNAFGIDFKAAGNTWTTQLCNKDSDGDGKTNGEELGDPNCVWTKGATPERSTGISHPGVCEAINSDNCKAKNILFGSNFCVSEDCHGTKGTLVMNLTFPRTEVPSSVTNYFCKAFEIPEEMYVYATEMIIDNVDIMHHALLFGCKSKPNDEIFKSPSRCFMSGSGCNEIISIWTIGAKYDCLDEKVHFDLGPNKSYQYVVLQYHWNNPRLLKGTYDASSMKIYYSKTPRNFTAAIITAGQLYLELKPGLKTISQTANIGPDCSRYLILKDTVYITSTLFHMHGKGKGGFVSQYRNNTFHEYLVSPGPYDYNEPKFIRPSGTGEFRRGDYIKMECQYSTVGQKYHVYYGEGTNDEMCFAFFRVYPKTNIRDGLGFLSIGTIDVCQTYLAGARPSILGNCNIKKFIDEIATPKKLQFDEFCKSSDTFCRQECREMTEEILANPCWQSYPYIFMKRLNFGVYERNTMKKIDQNVGQCRLEIEKENAAKQAVDDYKRKMDVALNGSSNLNWMVVTASINMMAVVFFTY